MKEGHAQSSLNSLEAGTDRSDPRTLSSAEKDAAHGISVTTDVEQLFSPRKSGDLEAAMDIPVNAWQAPTVTSGH